MNQTVRLPKTVRIGHSACPHDCPSTCALDVEVLDERTIGRVHGAKDNDYTAGVICAKVARYAEREHHAERLLHPLRRTGAKGSGKFERVSWDDALDLVAEKFIEAERRFGAESVWPYYYAGTMGLVMRDGIHRLRHAKKYSGFHSTICVNASYTGFAAGTGRIAPAGAPRRTRPRRPVLGVIADLSVAACRPGRRRASAAGRAARGSQDRGGSPGGVQRDLGPGAQPGRGPQAGPPDPLDLARGHPVPERALVLLSRAIIGAGRSDMNHVLRATCSTCYVLNVPRAQRATCSTCHSAQRATCSRATCSRATCSQCHVLTCSRAQRTRCLGATFHVPSARCYRTKGSRVGQLVGLQRRLRGWAWSDAMRRVADSEVSVLRPASEHIAGVR